MKHTLLFVFVFCLIQTTFSQNLDTKQYTLTDKNSANHYGSLLKSSKLIGTEDGIIVIESADMKIEGEITKLSIELTTDNKFEKNTLDLTYIKDRMILEGNIMGQPVQFIDSTTLNGKIIQFEKLADEKWVLKNDSLYNFIERNTITGDLKKLNEKRSPKVVDILYPEKMQLGDTLDLTPNTVLRFFELDDFETIKGTLILKEILVRNDETLAIFDIDIYFYGLVDEADKAYMTLKMNGILERSLTHFYDKKVEMLGMFKMKGNIGEGEYLTMETPATLIITQILH